MAGTEAKEPLNRGTILAIVALGLATFLIANDFTALSVALPNMESDFDADVSTVQWVINAYALVFGVLIVTGGRLADMFGRRNAFFVGAAIFAFFSLLSGLAPTVELLIAGRALMGIGGALMWPAVLGLTYEVLPESRQALAGPFVLGVAGMGNAFGPMLGGVLTDEASWRWIMLVNLPIAAGACLITYLKVPARPGTGREEGIDYAGVGSLTLGLVALLFALDQATDWGWGDPRIIGVLAVCVVSLLAFVAIERRAGGKALIPADVARNRTFVSACIAVVLMSATFFAILLYLPQIMQKLLGFSALQAGVGFLPFMVLFSVFAFLSGPLYERFGGRVLLVVGAACLPTGLFAITLAGESSPYIALVPGLVIAGLGVGLFYPTVTTVAVTALDKARAGLAGGLLYMCQIAGGSVGLGLTTTIFTASALSHVRGDALADRLSDAQEHAVGQILAGAAIGHGADAAVPRRGRPAGAAGARRDGARRPHRPARRHRLGRGRAAGGDPVRRPSAPAACAGRARGRRGHLVGRRPAAPTPRPSRRGEHDHASERHGAHHDGDHRDGAHAPGGRVVTAGRCEGGGRGLCRGARDDRDEQEHGANAHEPTLGRVARVGIRPGHDPARGARRTRAGVQRRLARPRAARQAVDDAPQALGRAVQRLGHRGHRLRRAVHLVHRRHRRLQRRQRGGHRGPLVGDVAGGVLQLPGHGQELRGARVQPLTEGRELGAARLQGAADLHRLDELALDRVDALQDARLDRRQRLRGHGERVHVLQRPHDHARRQRHQAQHPREDTFMGRGHAQ